MTRFERAAQIWSVLTLAARNRQILTYDIVGQLIGVPRMGIGQLLGPIQSYCLQEELPPLTILVVSDDTGMPGDGFIAAPDIPRSQANVFKFAWLNRQAPRVEELESAWNASQGPA